MYFRNLAPFGVLGLVGLVWAAAGGCGGETSNPGGTGGTSGTGGNGSGGQPGTFIDGGPSDAHTGPTFDAGNPGDGSTTACNVQADCAWGEIDHEILTAADCPCLYGCPYIRSNRTTVDRRRQQYAARCTPGYDGQGHACGIDDCIMPPTLLCVQGECLEAE